MPSLSFDQVKNLSKLRSPNVWVLTGGKSLKEWQSLPSSTCLVSKLIELRTNWTKLTLMNPLWPPQKTESGGFSSTAFYSAHSKVKLRRRIKTYLTEKMFVVQVENLSDLSDFEGKTT